MPPRNRGPFDDRCPTGFHVIEDANEPGGFYCEDNDGRQLHRTHPADDLYVGEDYWMPARSRLMPLPLPVAAAGGSENFSRFIPKGGFDMTSIKWWMWLIVGLVIGHFAWK